MAAPVRVPPRHDPPFHPDWRDELRKIELVESDGENMDSEWHRDCMNLLIEQVRCHHGARTDYFVGGNMFIYFDEEQARNRNFRGPDFFYVAGCRFQPERHWWAVWDEDDKFPNVLIELLSPSTEREDRISKFTVYELTFRTPEYFLYSPFTQRLDGFRLTSGRYLAISPDNRGWLWCEQLQLWLGTWRGEFQGKNSVWLRFYNPDGQVVFTYAEAARSGTEEAKQRAEDEKKRAEDEKKRADDALAELARLRAQLSQQPKPPGAG